MTEFHYQATGKFYPRGMFGEWDVSATYTDGSQSFNIASNAKSPVHLDSGLVNYLSYKHQTSSVFSKGQTFTTQFSVVGQDGTVLATPTLGYNVTKCTYTVTDDDWSRGGGYLATLVKALLSEKYGLTVTDFSCDMGTFQVTTWMYQPRSAGSAPAPQPTKPVDVKPTPAPAPKVEVIEVDPFEGGGMNIFGEGGDAGDY
jgi:hypothetical protein